MVAVCSIFSHRFMMSLICSQKLRFRVPSTIIRAPWARSAARSWGRLSVSDVTMHQPREQARGIQSVSSAPRCQCSKYGSVSLPSSFKAFAILNETHSSNTNFMPRAFSFRIRSRPLHPVEVSHTSQRLPSCFHLRGARQALLKHVNVYQRL